MHAQRNGDAMRLRSDTIYPDLTNNIEEAAIVYRCTCPSALSFNMVPEHDKHEPLSKLILTRLVVVEVVCSSTSRG